MGRARDADARTARRVHLLVGLEFAAAARRGASVAAAALGAGPPAALGGRPASRPRPEDAASSIIRAMRKTYE